MVAARGWAYVWDRSDQLYYISADSVYRVRVTAGPDGPRISAPERVLAASMLGQDAIRTHSQGYAPLPGGRSVLAFVSSRPKEVRSLVVVRHYERELARLLK